jgi:proteasome assembly chaperone (PAC2) family protein
VAVALIHHQMKSRVWVVTDSDKLNQVITEVDNTVLMSEAEGRGNQGSIRGLNGLLLGLAKKRGLETVSLMGEIPDYLSRAPFPYPKAAKSVLEVLSSILGVTGDCSVLDEMDSRMGEVINGIYEKFPLDVKEKIEHRKSVTQPKLETITDEDERWIKAHIDDLFRKGDLDERSS